MLHACKSFSAGGNLLLLILEREFLRRIALSAYRSRCLIAIRKDPIPSLTLGAHHTPGDTAVLLEAASSMILSMVDSTSWATDSS